MSDREPHRAKRSLGQNFLVDPNLQRSIAEAIGPGPDDELLEIGPGRGALTRHLAGRVCRLVLVELDNDLAARLTAEYAGRDDVHVVHADILDVPLEQLSAEPARLKVIGNIPYNITTPILFSLLERRPRPREIVLMVQREVAERILAEPGTKAFGALAVGVQSVAAAELVLHVGRRAFRPVPDVESSVVRIRPFDPPPLDDEDETALRTLTRIAFGQRRKQLQRILRDAYALDAQHVALLEDRLGLSFQARPETLSADQFIALQRALRALDAHPRSR